MKPSRSKNVVWTILLFVVLTVPMTHVSSSSPVLERIISSSGSIDLPQIEVTVESSTQIGTNAFSLGFMVDHDWKWWRDSSALRDLALGANFKLIRIFDWRTGGNSPDPCIQWDEATKTGTFDWTDVDLVVQGIFDAGAEPLICLGYYGSGGAGAHVPSGMAIDPSTGLPYPESFAAYAGHWVNHFKQIGLSVRYYEIFNEPAYYYGWGGSDTTRVAYFTELFNACYLKIHQINPDARVGSDSSNFKRVLDYFANHAVGLDYISMVHTYCSATVTDSDSTVLQKAEQLGFRDGNNIYSADNARQIWYNAHGVTLPVLISETNFSWAYETGTDPRIQQMVGVVCHALQIRMSVLHDLDYLLYFCFSSSETKEQRSQTGGYGFGMVNSDDNQPWYPYYLMKMIGNNLRVGDTLLKIDSGSDDIRPLAWTHEDKLNILLICKVDQQRTVKLQGLQGELAFIKIDETVSWETPSLQTGVIAATSYLTMNGYTTTLLQMTM